MKVLLLLITLSATVVLVICSFGFFREDKEEHITPLCPGLVVRDAELKFRHPALSLRTQADSARDIDVLDYGDPADCICKVTVDFPDPFRGSPHGVAATVRIHKSDMTLATVVARNVSVSGQGLALCRIGSEIFGFVEPDGNRYVVRHRTGVDLMTLIGSFDDWDIEGVNPVGTKVFSMKQVGDECVGSVNQHVDAGLVLSALLAIHVHRRLSQPGSAKPMPAVQPEPASVPEAPQPTMPVESEPSAMAAGISAHYKQLQASDISGLRSPPVSNRATREEDPESPPLGETGTAPAAAG